MHPTSSKAECRLGLLRVEQGKGRQVGGCTHDGGCLRGGGCVCSPIVVILLLCAPRLYKWTVIEVFCSGVWGLLASTMQNLRVTQLKENIHAEQFKTPIHPRVLYTPLPPTVRAALGLQRLSVLPKSSPLHEPPQVQQCACRDSLIRNLGEHTFKALGFVFGFTPLLPGSTFCNSFVI